MSNLIQVPFQGSTLYIVDHNGEPFVPMRPIVEGMGLDWASQTVKLNSNKNRWGVVMITIPSVGGMQETLCIPHRKLPAWLAAIQPSRVKPEIRDTIIFYQNECDDVLWDYWTKGRAINPRGINIVDTPQNYSAADLRDLSTAARAASEAAYAESETILATAKANRILADTALALANQYANPAPTPAPVAQTESQPQPKPQPLLPPREVAFIHAWWNCLGNQTVTASDLYRTIATKQCQELHDSSGALLGDVAQWTPKKLSYAMRRWSQLPLDDFTVLSMGKTGRGITWRLERKS